MLERKDEETLKVAAILHRQWGLRFTKVGKNQAAIDAFRRALEEGGDHLTTLIGLCVALLENGNYVEADEISKKCFAIDPGNYEAKWLRVETLYKIGEFGSSLVHAYRGYHQRRYPFENGVFCGREALENCIGRNTADSLMEELIPWMRKLEERRNSLIAKLSSGEENELGYTEEYTKFRVNDPEYQREYRMKKFRRMLTRRYQGYLADDTLFLEGLLENSDSDSTKKRSNQQLLALIQKHLTRSSQTTEVARIHKSLYVFRFKRREITTPGWKKSQLNERLLRKHNIVIEVHSMLMRLHEARVARNYPLFFSYVDRAKYKLDSYHTSMFPQKSDCLRELYKMVAHAYVDPRDVTGIKDPTARERYLKHHLGIREAVLPRDEDLAWIPCGQERKSKLEVFRRRLALTSEPLELAWLFHELSKLHVETKSLDLARFYAKKSRDWSTDAGDDWWTLNANHLLIRIEIHHHNRNEAKEAAILCYLGAKKMGLDFLADFYVKIARIVDTIDLERMKGLDGIAIREKIVSKLMPTEKLKREMDFLLQRMDVVPARRRLSIVPGCKTIDKKFKLPCKRNTIRVKPTMNPIKESQRILLRQYAPSRKIPGWMDFEDYR
ncbi:tetratricopeptide repeat protein 25 [Diachasma alloeum]|uniref:tetratricopeptide repeat protein 25 n=1 Tax=Diachasma alloeum TaxID=454923 RepID=UPI0007382EB4|nr:tetratricopeptide repeat protein 25 [Diachasma alloeum]